MSYIGNVVSTTFRAVGAQAVVQQARMMGAGMGQLYNNIQKASSQSTVLSAQWKAMGTTIRYALAGQAVFGITRMIGQLKDVQQQLGLISAIGELPGGRPIVGDNLTKLMGDIRTGAVQSLTPINEYNDAVINLLSTVQGVPLDKITPMVTTIARAAKLSQVSAEDATKAFTTMNVAFQRKPTQKNVANIAQEFAILTKEAPGGVSAGQQIIGQLGQLAALTKSAGGTPEEMFGLLLSGLRGGIPPSQAGRGLQYFLQTIAFPANQAKPARDALASVGINAAHPRPLATNLKAIFGRARQLGVRGNLGTVMQLGEEETSAMDAAGGLTPKNMATLGLSGRGTEFLGTVFRRVHSLRMALALETQIETGKFAVDMKTMTDAGKGHVRDIDKLSNMWSRLSTQAKLQEASVAVNALGLQLAQVFEPIANFGAQGIVKLQEFANKHPAGTRDVALGVGGAAAVLGTGRWLGARGLLGLGSKVAGGAQAVQSLTGTAPDGSLGNPFYVRVVGGIFNTGITPVTPHTPGPGPGPSSGGVSKWGRLAKGLGTAAATVAVVDTANELTGRQASGGKSLFDPSLYTGGGNEKPINLFGLKIPNPNVGLNLGPKIWHGIFGGGGKKDPGDELRQAQQKHRTAVSEIQNTMKLNMDDVRKAQSLLGKPVDGGRVLQILDEQKRTGPLGKAELVVTVNVSQPDGTTKTEKFHITPTAWKNGSHPTRAGRPGARR